jgi:excinuclease ABC subunit C
MIAKERLKRLPKKTGVYIFKDGAGEFLYVGKAIDLRRRVSSYFARQKTQQPLMRAVAPRAEDVECIVTDTEKEALLLENTLIKEHRPRYNVSLKDDKTYVYIRLSVNEQFPRLTIIRRPTRDGAHYFGPYSSADAARKTIRFLQRLFPLRSCSAAEFGSRERPCIKYQIKRCTGPCCRMIGEDDYGVLARRVELFLGGKTGDLLNQLEKEMKEAAAMLDYERARKIRDTVEAIRVTLEKQKSVMSDRVDRDAVGVYREGTKGEVAILCVRGGRLIGKKAISIHGMSEGESAFMRKFLLNHYLGGAFIPSEILLPLVPENRAAIASLLSEEKNGPLRLTAPRRGDKNKLVKMARSNAEASFHLRRERKMEVAELLEEMRKKLHLPWRPVHLECVDISNLGGREAVGSIVAFVDGKENRDAYRRFSIKTVHGADDCAMIYEVLMRRLQRGKNEGNLPDLVLVDGGRAQLGAALRAIKDLKIKKTAVAAIAKEREEEKKRKPDRIYLEGRRNSIPLKAGDGISLFLQHVRDEAHRFALSYHRTLRKKCLLFTELERVSGVGKKRSALLLKELGDVESVAESSLDRLGKILGNREVAKRIYNYFH